MLTVAFVRWWYGAGWQLIQHNVRRRLQRTRDSFSVPTLVQTLFAPWKRIVTAPGAGIDAHFRAMVDNTVSRLVGFTIRLTVLFSAGLCLLGIGLIGMLQIALWPLMPLLIIACLVLGVMG